MTRNFWSDHAGRLVPAFERHVGPVRYELVTRAIFAHLPVSPHPVLDLGGGFGHQAIRLARAGYRVTIVDFDDAALMAARKALQAEDAAVQARIDMILGTLTDLGDAHSGRYALACCHSVLMYEADPAPMLSQLVRCVRPGGLLSVLSLNPEAVAMRSGLQGRWREAACSLKAGHERGHDYLPTAEHSRARITQLLAGNGARELACYGVGVFTDHMPVSPDRDDLANILELEWMAGTRDPYRQVARCFHLIAQRESARSLKAVSCETPD